MIKKISGVIVAIAVFLAVGAFAADMKNFSADMETTTPQGRIDSKIYVKDGKQRLESTQMGSQTVSIVRTDKGVIWMLMPSSRTYMEMPLGGMHKEMPPGISPSTNTEEEFVGLETVEGHPAKKYHVRIIKDGTKEDAGYVWKAIDLGDFPIKYQNEDNTVTTVWRNIMTGNVPDTLFEIPSGYAKSEMPPMPGMPGMPGMPKMPGPGGFKMPKME